jgi:integrase
MNLYSTAVRRSELCRLQASDIDSQRMMIRIHQDKGRRDRDVPLRPKLLETLRLYWHWRKPKTYLFPGTISRLQRWQRRRRPHLRQHRLAGLSPDCLPEWNYTIQPQLWSYSCVVP